MVGGGGGGDEVCQCYIANVGLTAAAKSGVCPPLSQTSTCTAPDFSMDAILCTSLVTAACIRSSDATWLREIMSMKCMNNKKKK